MGFIRAYIKSMRPYTFFVTGIAGLIGMLLFKNSLNIFQEATVLLILFLSYGVNQVINDLLGLKEDKINAPKRPSVSGELNRKSAIIVTSIIFILGGVVTYFLNPFAIVIYFCGYLSNILYEYIKSVPLIGNLWFGGMISLATIYGGMISSGDDIIMILGRTDLLYAAFLVMLSSSTLCYFTYFKDYIGDKKAGKKTAIVWLTPKYAAYFGFFMSLIPFIGIFFITLFDLWSLKLNGVSLCLFTITFLLFQYAAYSYYKEFDTKKTLELIFESAVFFHICIAALLIPYTAIFLYLGSFIVIRIIFKIMYKKEFY